MAASPVARKVASWVWALSPFVTIGLITPVTFGYAAVRRRSGWLALAAALYLALFVLVIALPVGSVGDAVSAVALAVTMLGGTGHALVIRGRVFGTAGSGSFEEAAELAIRRRELRREAVELARTRPEVAREMRIGRPDLPRNYDDGGLIDINHAPPSALLGLPEMTPELVRQIILVREQTGGFVSAEEVSALAELPPQLTPHLAEFGIFLP